MQKINIEKQLARITEQLKRWDIPGLSLAIVQGEDVYAGGAGSRDNGAEPFTGNTLVQIASCTKAFTAALTARLATEGLLDMDRPVADYIPGFRLSEEYPTLNLTIRDFLSHRSGLPRHEYAWYGSGYSRSQLMHNLRYLQMTQPIRYTYQYSNFNYLIAGALIEAVTGMKFETCLYEKLIKPLGMDSTRVYLDEIMGAEDRALPFDHTYEYTMTGIKPTDYYKSPAEVRSENPEEKTGDPTAAAGCIVSCAKDMARWLRFNLDGGRLPDGEQYIREDLMQLLVTPHCSVGDDPATLPQRSTAGYALGWQIYNYRGVKMAEHGGNLPGFSSSTAFIPQLDLGIFVSANMTVSLISDAVVSEIIDEVMGFDDGGWYDRRYKCNEEMFAGIKAFFKAFGGEPQPGTAPSHPLEDYCGEYRAPGYNRFLITLQDGVLNADFNTWKPGLKHHHYDSFATTDAMGELPSGLILTFGSDGTGNITTLTATLGTEKNLKPIVFIKQ